MSQEKSSTVSMENIYRLNGRVPIAKAIPFGLQHVLAMFVANLSPMTIIAAAAQPALSQQEVAMLIQNAMFAAGIATMIQLYPLWKIGSKLPIVMGVSFTFVTIRRSSVPFLSAVALKASSVFSPSIGRKSSLPSSRLRS